MQRDLNPIIFSLLFCMNLYSWGTIQFASYPYSLASVFKVVKFYNHTLQMVRMDSDVLFSSVGASQTDSIIN